MSNPSPNPSPPPNQNRPNLMVFFLQKARSPLGIATGVGLLLLSIAGYVGVRFVVYQKLPSLLSKELSQTLNRPVQLGQVTSFSLTGIYFGKSEIPATPTDPDKVTIGSIQVGFNLLPVLVKQPLPISITLADLDAYFAQDEDGKWIDLELDQSSAGARIPDLDIKVKLPKAEVAFLAQGNKVPLKIRLDADGRYNQAQSQQLQYDVRTIFSQGSIQIKGETLLETGNSQVQVAVENLVLANLVSLISNSIFELKEGEINANLNLEFPSLEQLTSTQAEGQIILSPFNANVKPFLEPLNGSASLRFVDTKMQVEQGEVSLGEIRAQVEGEVDWEQGYNLSVNTNSFSLTNLLSTVPISLPFSADGSLEVKLKLTGALAQPVLHGRLTNTQTIRLDQVEFKEISTLFQADLSKIVLKNWQAVPVAGGKITGQGTIETRLGKSLLEKKSLDLMTMPMDLDFKVELPQAIASPYYKLPPEITSGNITAQAQVRGTLAEPQAALKWRSRQQSNLEGVTPIAAEGEVLLENKNLFLRNTTIEIDRGKIAIDGSSNLVTQTWQTDISVSSLALNPLLDLIDWKNRGSSSISLEKSQIRLSGRLDTLDLATIEGVGNLILQVDGGNAVVNTQLSQGNLQVTANAGKISLTKFLPNLPLPVSLVTSQVNVSASLKELLSLGSNPNLHNFKANADLRLAVGDGTLKATTQLNNGQLEGSIFTSGIDSSFPDLEAELKAAITLAPLAVNNPSASIQAQTISVKFGQQSVQAQGNILFSNLTTAPDIDRLQLDIKARSDLDTLALNELLDLLPLEREFLPQRIDLMGTGDFQGRLVGQNLLSAPLAPGNLQLLGKLQLSNFSLNQLVFDPLLVGSVEISPGEKLAINLRGKDDAIAAILEPCNQRRCILPYLPVSFELLQGEGLENSIMASGKRQGERLIAEVKHFPLSLLSIAPTTQLGIIGTLQGKVTTQLDINLVTLAGTGNLQIQQPGIGFIQAQELAASFSAQNNLISLESAYLKFQRSQYDFQGILNVQSGQINGKVSVNQGYIEDVLTILSISDLESLVSFLQFQPPVYAKADDLQVQSVGNVNASLAQQINILSQIDQQIRILAIEKRAGRGRREVDLAGAYTAEITLAGTWKQPQIQFNLQGSQWDWRTQAAFPSVVQSLGFVLEDTHLIPVHQVLLQGSLQQGVLTLEPMQIEVANATLYMAGNFSPQNSSAQLSLKNISLDTISDDIVKLPLDIAGRLDLEVNLEGSLTQPQINAEVAWIDGAINGGSLQDKIVANLNYSNSRLEVNTTYPDSLKIYASLPYPTEPGISDRFNIEVELTNKIVNPQQDNTATNSLTLVQDFLAGLTQGEILWVSGEGKIALQASGSLDLTQRVKVSDLLVTGEAIFQDARFKNPSIAKELNLTGKITLDNQRLQAEQLQGSFAETNLLLTGVLPVWKPLNPDAPDFSNPLKLTIDQGQMNLPKLYQGNIDTQVTVTGTLLAPVIEGKVLLYEGEAFLPKPRDLRKQLTPAIEGWISSVRRNVVTTYGKLISPKLENFQLVLGERFVLRNYSTGLLKLPGILNFNSATPFKFGLSGDITLNGFIDNLDNLQPQGTIRLKNGSVEIIAAKVFVARRYDNRIDFTPEEGLFNPKIDIQVKSYLFNIGIIPTIGNEIPDEISRSGRVQSIELTVGVKARVEELLPQLSQTLANVCQIRPANIKLIPQTESFSPAELQQLSRCVELGASIDLTNSTQLYTLLSSPAITITSSPTLTKNEIIALLGAQNQETIEALQQQNSGQLLNLGLTQLVLAPFIEGIIFQVNEGSNYAGSKIGLSDVRLYPVIETVPQVSKNSWLRFSYDYFYNETKIIYETLLK
ncbi:MAG: translocation/assembly module TamB domain-containing protein [Xenococcaceae cyanobacterium MO_167.B52]|nr:translocation/assembly module TamB domain-containing protein [Xenococcaceae cyanobacterium MO_167.B52]